MKGNVPYKILIVDDDRFLLSMYSTKFQKEKFDVTIAGDGSEALKKLQNGFGPDVIVLDMIMPVMGGIEFLEKIRGENLAKDATLLVLSNQDQSSDIDNAKRLGVDGYIVKATTIPSEVVTEVQRMLSDRKYQTGDK